MKSLFKQSFWYEGLLDDSRIPTQAGFAESVNFDIQSSPRKLIPTIEWEREDSGTNNEEITKLNQDSNEVYAVGEDSSGDIDILSKNISSGNFESAVTSVVGSNRPFRYDLFLKYDGHFWGWTSSEELWKFEISTGVLTLDVFDPGSFSSFDSAPQGLVDQDVAFIPYNNYIGTIDGTNWTPDKIVIPENESITALAKWRGYIAIASVDENRNSFVRLWDGVSETFTTKIAFGYGRIQILENLLGELIAITHLGRFTAEVRNKTVIKRYNGGAVIVWKELDAEDGYDNTGSWVYNNRLYFATKEGIWSLGRRDVKYPLSLCLYKGPISFDSSENDFEMTDLIFIGSEMWIAAENGGQKRVEKVPVNSDDYDIASVTTMRTNSGSLQYQKQISEVIVNFDPLPSGAELSLYYKVDSDTEWTEVFVADENDQTTFVATMVGNDIGNDFRPYHEVQFKLESRNGAVPSDIQVYGEVLNHDAE